MDDRTFSFTIPEVDDEATAILTIAMIMDELALDLDQRRRIAEYLYDRYPYIEVNDSPKIEIHNIHNIHNISSKEENNEQHF